MMDPEDVEELYLSAIRAPVVLVVFLGLWGVVLLVLQALRIEYSSVIALPGGEKTTEAPRTTWDQVVLLALGIFILLLGCLNIGWAMHAPPTLATGTFYLLVGVMLLFSFPTSTSRREHAALFFRSLGQVVCPSTDVHFTDVLVADALTSLSRVFADAGVVVLLLVQAWGGECPPWLKYAVCSTLASFPYWVRVRQCATQYASEVDGRRRRLHMVNLGKYLSSFPLVWMSGLDEFVHSQREMVVLGRAVVAASLVNSLYSFLWDVKMDWGLGQAGAKRWGLRNTLLINHEAPWPYYTAVWVDFILRMAWLLKLFEDYLTFTDLALMLQLVEVCRRSMWSVFRLEWECIQCTGTKADKLLHLDKGDDALRV